MNKEEFLKKIYTRREAEQFLELTNSALQHHLRVGRIKPVKEFGTGRGKVQLFWEDDLKKLKDFIKNA